MGVVHVTHHLTSDGLNENACVWTWEAEFRVGLGRTELFPQFWPTGDCRRGGGNAFSSFAPRSDCCRWGAVGAWLGSRWNGCRNIPMLQYLLDGRSSKILCTLSTTRFVRRQDSDRKLIENFESCSLPCPPLHGFYKGICINIAQCVLIYMKLCSPQVIKSDL